MGMVTAVLKVSKKGSSKAENLGVYVVVEKVGRWSDTMDENEVATMVLSWAVMRAVELAKLSVDKMVVAKVVLLVETMVVM